MSIQPQHETTWIPVWSFSDRLRRIRRELGVTQDEFAVLLGAGGNQYKAWESGRNTPRDIVTVAKRLELLTMVPASWTLGLDEGLGGSNPNGPGDSKKADEVSNPRNKDYKAEGSGGNQNVFSLWPSRIDDFEWAQAA